jgi:multidrug efflux pump subunit AcrA (membrane-fusion protein)
VDKAIHTVVKNLIEGGVIVVLVLLLLLGNLRAGLVVAGMIPLCMLFALGMMRTFGASANLMSLGALDFGLIVDGAVIIMEAVIAHLLHERLKAAHETMDDITEGVTNRLMKSALFGQLIMLIVYLPILSLTGIEGKMFRPMALTVSFAILGAMLMCLTYVPAVTAWALKNISEKPNLADRIVGFLHRLYDPIIRAALGARWLVVGVDVGLLALGSFVFSRLGGEFIPQLDEGDFAMNVTAILRSPDYLKLQQDYLQSQARIVFLKQETARQQTLNDEDVGARRKLQQATSEQRTEQAAAGSLAAQLRLIGLNPGSISATNIQPSVPLTAPIGGYVKAVLVNPGQFVNPQDVLIELVDRSDLHLELKVFERDIAKVKVGQDILFRVPAQGANSQPLPATVFLVGKAFDNDGRTVSVHAYLHDTGPDAAATAALLPGQYVSASILTGRTPQRTLPEDALVPGGEVSYAYYQVKSDAKGSTFRRFSLRPGATDQGQVAVRPLDKLSDTTHLVVKGAYFLDAERSKGQGNEE